MDSKTFWFKKPNKKRFYFAKYIRNINYVYITFLILTFSWFSFYDNFWKIVLADDKISILKQDFKELAMYFWPIDNKLSNSLLIADKLNSSYMSGNDIISDNKADIIYLMNYFQNNYKNIVKFWFKDYEWFLSFMSQLFNYKNDLFSLLWEKWKQTYLIVLQNMSERRPNWWFFWSFLVVNVENSKIDYKLYDSYIVNYLNSWNYLLIPEWANQFLEDPKLYFVSVNKFWFTDIDWANIKKLYEWTFTWDNVRWVIFVKSDLLEKIVPGFQRKIIEWQFMNASIDLIRWKALPFKKELYMKDMTTFLEKNYVNIAKSFLKNFDDILKWDYVNIYLTWWVSKSFQNFLVNKELTTRYNPNKIYFWDSNIAFNKIDRFVQKTVHILDSNWTIIKEFSNDTFDITDLKPWTYKAQIVYNLNVPDWYIKFLANLEKKFNIKLTKRETFIFGLTYYWHNRWLIYLPKDMKVYNIQWDIYYSKYFDWDFSSNIVYKIKSEENNATKFVEFEFIKE